jgi:hypothetical protein
MVPLTVVKRRKNRHSGSGRSEGPSWENDFDKTKGQLRQMSEDESSKWTLMLR